MAGENEKTALPDDPAKALNRGEADRTLMGWIQTSISLIGFGFAIAKSYEYIEGDYAEKTGRVLDSMHAPLIFGSCLMVLGLLGILAGVLEYQQILGSIGSKRSVLVASLQLTRIMAITILIIGVLGTVMLLI